MGRRSTGRNELCATCGGRVVGSITGTINMPQHATAVRNLFAEEHWFGVSVSTMLLERRLCTPCGILPGLESLESSCRGRDRWRDRQMGWVDRKRRRKGEGKRGMHAHAYRGTRNIIFRAVLHL
jgi:hypothetical protein